MGLFHNLRSTAIIQIAVKSRVFRIFFLFQVLFDSTLIRLCHCARDVTPFALRASNPRCTTWGCVGKWTAFNAESAAWFDLPLYKYMYCRP
jgi:hypothetical protein